MLGLYNKCIQSLDNYPNVILQTRYNWDIVTDVQTDFTVRWNQGAGIEIDFTLEYNTAGKVTNEFTCEWDVNLESLPVFIDATLEWNVQTELQLNFGINWNISPLEIDEQLIISNSAGVPANSPYAVYDFTGDVSEGGGAITTSSQVDNRDLTNRCSGDKAFNSDDQNTYEGSMFYTDPTVSVAGESSFTIDTTYQIEYPLPANELTGLYWQIHIPNSTRDLKLLGMRFTTPDGLYQPVPAGSETLLSYPDRIRILASPNAGMDHPDTKLLFNGKTEREERQNLSSQVFVDIEYGANEPTMWFKFNEELSTVEHDWYIRIQIYSRHVPTAHTSSHLGTGFKNVEFAARVEEKYNSLDEFITDTDAKIALVPYRPESQLVDTVVLENRANPGFGDFTVDFQGNGSSTIGYTTLSEYQPVIQGTNVYSSLSYDLGDTASATRITNSGGAFVNSEAREEWTLFYYGKTNDGLFTLNALGGGAPALAISNSGTTLTVRNNSGTTQAFTVPAASNSALTYICRNGNELLHVVFEGTTVYQVTRLSIEESYSVTEDLPIAVDHINPITLGGNVGTQETVGTVVFWARKLSISEMYTMVLVLSVGTNVTSNSTALTRIQNEGTTLGSIYEGTVSTVLNGDVISSSLNNVASTQLEQGNVLTQNRLIVPSTNQLGEYSYLSSTGNNKENTVYGGNQFAPVFMGAKNVSGGEATWVSSGSQVDLFSTSKNYNDRYDCVAVTVEFAPEPDIFYNPLIPIVYQVDTGDLDDYFVDILMSNRFLYVCLRRQQITNTDQDFVTYEIESPYSVYGTGLATLVTVNVPLVNGGDIEWIVNGRLVGSATIDFDPYLGKVPVGNLTNSIPNLYTMGKAFGNDTFNGGMFAEASDQYGSAGSGILGVHKAYNDTYLHSGKDVPTNVRLFSIGTVYRRITPAEDRIVWESKVSQHPTTLSGLPINNLIYSEGYLPLWETDSFTHENVTKPLYNAIAKSKSSLSGTSLGYNQKGYTGGVLAHKQAPRDLRASDSTRGNPFRHIGGNRKHYIEFFATPIDRPTSGTSAETWRPAHVMMEQRMVGIEGGWQRIGNYGDEGLNTFANDTNEPSSAGVLIKNNERPNTTTSSIFISENRGLSFREVDVSGQFGNLQLGAYTPFNHDGTAGVGRWFGIEDTKVYYSDDSGETWTLAITLANSRPLTLYLVENGWHVTAGYNGGGFEVFYTTTPLSSWTASGTLGASNSIPETLQWESAANEWVITLENGRVAYSVGTPNSWVVGYIFQSGNRDVQWAKWFEGRWFVGLTDGYILRSASFQPRFQDLDFATGFEVAYNVSLQPASLQKDSRAAYIDENGDLISIHPGNIGDPGYAVKFTDATNFTILSGDPWADLKVNAAVRYDTDIDTVFLASEKFLGEEASYQRITSLDVPFSIGTDNTGRLQIGRKTKNGSELNTFNANADLSVTRLHHILLELDGNDVTCWVNGVSAGTQAFTVATGQSSTGDLADVFSIGHGIDVDGEYVQGTESGYLISHLGVWYNPYNQTELTAPGFFSPRYSLANNIAAEYTGITQAPSFQLLASDLQAGTGNNTAYADGQSITNWYDNISNSLQFATVQGTVQMRTGTDGMGIRWDGSNTPAVKVQADDVFDSATADKMRLTAGQSLYNVIGDDDASATGTDKGTMFVVGRLGADTGQYNSNISSFATGGDSGAYLGIKTATGDDTEVIARPEALISSSDVNRLYSVAVNYHDYDMTRVAVLGNSWYYKNYTMNADGYSDVLRSGGVSVGGQPGEMYPLRDVSNPEDDATQLSNTNSPLTGDGAWLFGYDDNAGGQEQQFNGYLSEISWYDAVFDQWQYNLLHTIKGFENGLVVSYKVSTEIEFRYGIAVENIAVTDNPDVFTLTTYTFRDNVATTFAQNDLPFFLWPFQAVDDNSDFALFNQTDLTFTTRNFLFDEVALMDNPEELTLTTYQAQGISVAGDYMYLIDMNELVDEGTYDDYVADWIFDKPHMTEGSNIYVADLSGNDLTIYSTSRTYRASRRRGIGSVNPGSNYFRTIAAKSSSTLTSPTNVTFVHVFRVFGNLSGVSTDRNRIAGNGGVNTSSNSFVHGYQIAITGDYKPCFCIGSNTGLVEDTDFVEVVGSTVLSQGEIYVITGTYDGTTARLYVDDGEDAFKSYSGGLAYDNPTQANSFYIELGSRYKDATTSAGIGNNLMSHNASRIYDRALSGTEVANMVASTYPPVPPQDYISKLTFSELSTSSTDAPNSAIGYSHTGLFYTDGVLGYDFRSEPFSPPTMDIIPSPNGSAIDFSASPSTNQVYGSYITSSETDTFHRPIFTMVIVFRASTTGALNGILSFGNSTLGYRIQCLATGEISTLIRYSGGTQTYNTTGTYDDNQWHTYMMTHDDAGQTTIYIDGAQQTQVTQGAISYSQAIQLGRSWFNSNYVAFDGALDKMYYYNRILNTSERASFLTSDLI